MGLFTINFELGEKTLETLSEIARVVKKSAEALRS